MRDLTRGQFIDKMMRAGFIPCDQIRQWFDPQTGDYIKWPKQGSFRDALSAFLKVRIKHNNK
jgi:hypothetical protein